MTSDACGYSRRDVIDALAESPIIVTLRGVTPTETRLPPAMP
jgi:hypothetical protein